MKKGIKNADPCEKMSLFIRTAITKTTQIE